MVKINWTSFKTYFLVKNEYPQMIEFNDRYELFYTDSGLNCFCLIFKSDPVNADQLDFETNYKTKVNKKYSLAIQPFDTKELLNGKKLFRRAHGISGTMLASGNTEFLYTIPYNNCKINKMELLWIPEGVKVDFQVLDTATCTIQASMGIPEQDRIPNLMLNQFAFDVNITKDYHIDESKYDADLIKDMIIKIIIKNETLTTKTIGINFILHEVK